MLPLIIGWTTRGGVTERSNSEADSLQRVSSQKWSPEILTTSTKHQEKVFLWLPPGLLPEGPNSKNLQPNYLKDVAGAGIKDAISQQCGIRAETAHVVICVY